MLVHAQATATVINRALTDFGFDQVLGSVRGFVKFSASTLLDDTIEILPREKIVVGVLNIVDPNPEIPERLHELRRKGFAVALDHFRGPRSPCEPFLPFADILPSTSCCASSTPLRPGPGR